jgi:hypothetical protein
MTNARLKSTALAVSQMFPQCSRAAAKEEIRRAMDPSRSGRSFWI